MEVPEPCCVLPVPDGKGDGVERPLGGPPAAAPGALRVGLALVVVPPVVVGEAGQLLNAGVAENVLRPADVLLGGAQAVGLDFGHQLGGGLNAVVLAH